MSPSFPKAKRPRFRWLTRFSLRSLLAFAVIAVAGVVIWQWRVEQQIAVARRESWRRRQADEAYQAQLDVPIVADGRKLTLDALPAYLAEHTGLLVEFDDLHLVDEGVDPSEASFILPVGRVSARAILAHALLQFELWYDVRGRRILITTPEQLEQPGLMHLAIYPAPQPGLTASTTEQEWRDLVSTVIQPQTWNDVGGPAHIEAVPGGLAVVQTQEGHKEISNLFARLGQMENPPRSWAPVPLVPANLTAAEQQIELILDEPISIEVQEETLQTLVAELSGKYKLPIVLNLKKLEEAGISRNMQVTLRLTNVPLRTALRRLLNELELTFVVRHEMVQVTTPEDAESNLTITAYPVHDLVLTADDVDFDALIEVITVTVAPQSWDEVGGPGSIYALPRGWLIVSQTDHEHAQLVDFLANLRRALAEGGPQPYPLGSSAAEQRIEAALEREIDFEYTSTSLTDICKDLSSQLGINICVNARKLEEAGVAADEPVNCRFPRASLRVQLRRLCDPLELGYCIRGNTLFVTTPEDVESELQTRIYDARALTDPDLGLTDIGTLAEFIQSHIEPQSWEGSGPGQIMVFNDMLVFSQMEDVHRQAANLLQQLEAHCLSFVPPAYAPNLVRSPANAVEERIEQVLQQPAGISLCGVPLDEAMQQISAAANMSITLSLKGLEEEGISEWTVVSHSGGNLPLGQMLDEILAPLDLTYHVSDEQILITNSYRGSYRSTHFYPVADLVARNQSDGDAFLSRLEAEVVPQDWNNTGGNNMHELFSNRWLVITGDSTLHLYVEDWLDHERTAPPGIARPPVRGRAPRTATADKPSRYAPHPSPDKLAHLRTVDVRLLIGACELSTGTKRTGDPRYLRELKLVHDLDPFAAP